MLKILCILLLLCGSCQAADLAWNASVVDEQHAVPTGYRIHWGSEPGVYTGQADAGLALTWHIPDDWYGQYFFAASAYNSAGQSGYSNEVLFTRDQPQQHIGATGLAASRYQVEEQMADSTLYTNAIAIYDFENNLNDTKAGAKNLTASGTPTYSTTGEAQGTYWIGELSGAYGYRDDASFRFSGDYSVSLWAQFVYVTEGYYTVLAQCYESGSEGDGWTIDTDGSRHLRVRHTTNFSSTSAVFSGATLSNNTRYHIVIAYSDSANIVTAWVSTTSFGNIINGTTVAMTANPGTSAAQRFYVGHSNIDSDELYGYIDELVLWASAITSSDSAAIFAARDGGTSWRETAGGASAVPVIMRSYRARRN